MHLVALLKNCRLTIKHYCRKAREQREVAVNECQNACETSSIWPDKVDLRILSEHEVGEAQHVRHTSSPKVRQ